MAVLECREGLGQALPGDRGLGSWDPPQDTWVKDHSVSSPMDSDTWT